MRSEFVSFGTLSTTVHPLRILRSRPGRSIGAFVVVHNQSKGHAQVFAGYVHLVHDVIHTQKVAFVTRSTLCFTAPGGDGC